MCRSKGTLLSGAPVPFRRQFWSQGSNFAVRDGQWKLVRQGSTPWLFNIATDRDEKTNKASGMQAKVDQLQGYINTWRHSVGR